MRFTICATALTLIALPATAQQLDTTRTDIKTEDGGLTATCGFAAMPGLELTQIADVPYAATWSGPAREPGGSLNLMFVAPPSLVTELMVASAYVQLPPGTAKPVSAEARFDGRASGIAFEISGGSDGSPRYTVNPISTADYTPKLMAASTLELEVRDAGHVPIITFSWDVNRLRLIPQLLTTVRWRCIDQ